MNKPYSEAVCAMIDLMRMHKALVSDRVASLYPHRTAHMMLMYLSHTDFCYSQKELAEHFHLTPAAVTGILKKLEGDGYISRKSGTDSRNNLISITEEGLRMVCCSREVFFGVDEILFSGFDDDEIQKMIINFNRMKANIEMARKEGEDL